MNLIKTSILSFIATAIKLVAGIVINKAISLFVGPAGLALIGQFQNSSTLIRTLAQGGINSGVVKYTAEYGSDEVKKKVLWSTALQLTVLFSIVVGVVLICGSTYWANVVFNGVQYRYVFIIFGLTLIVFSINQLLLSILNGLKEIRSFISIQIIQSIYSLIFTSALVYFYHLDGALIALVTNQSMIFFVVLWRLRNHKEIIVKNFLQKWQSDEVKKLLKYSMMALISAAVAPISQIVVRNYVAENIDWDHAGYWQAMTYISNMYLMVITTALSAYYLPRLSEIQVKSELREELKSGYKIIIPIVTALALCVFVLKDFIIWLLFSTDFKPMAELFKWQLIGDVIKITAWLLSYLMLARAMITVFIVTEILFATSFAVFSIYFVELFGFVGLSYAFAMNYAIYLLVMILIMKKKLY